MSLILELDLIPSTCWFSNLRSELPKVEWDRLRRTQCQQGGYRCEICGGRGSRHPVECHEIWSYLTQPVFESNIGTRSVQYLEGLIALCPSCHEVKHFGLAVARGRKDQATNHFRRVNGLSESEATTLLAKEFAIWEQRSQNHWDLDIEWLADKGIDTSLLLSAAQSRQVAQDLEQGEDALAAMTDDLGPCPEDRIRLGLTHSCGHGSALEVSDPETLSPVDQDLFKQALEAYIEDSCPTCLGIGPPAPVEPLGESPVVSGDLGGPDEDEVKERPPTDSSQVIGMDGGSYDLV